MQSARHPARRHPLPRGGFTLIELMVVIIVIALLAALLFPAIRGAMLKVREATVVTEMSSFDRSLTEFKSRYGVDVPSFIVLCELGTDWSNDWSMTPPSGGLPPGITDAHRRASRAFIRQVWPDFDFSYSATGGRRDFNGDDTATPDDTLVLNGSECLVFFLGGVVRRGATLFPDTAPFPAVFANTMKDDALVGFAANPQNPFDSTSSNNRVGPFFTAFSVDRFIDVDNDGMPEYRDGLSGQQRPYVYVSSYGGTGYKPWGADNAPGNADDEIPIDAGGARLMNDAYRKDDGTATGPYLNLQSYQLISPGIDYELGTGGPYNGTGVPSTRLNERDNITNFKSGRLN